MADDDVIHLKLRLPWWTSLYVWALRFSECCGIIEVDSEIAWEFIIRHTKFEVAQNSGR